MTSSLEMQAALEAVLFSSADLIPREKLLDLFEEAQRERAQEALETVLDRYRSKGEDGVEDGYGIRVDEVGHSVRLVTRADLNSYLRKFYDISAHSKLSMAALETLAIVAYRQPITAPEIQDLRSKGSGGVLKTLLEKRLIKISGRKEVVGKPFLYSTTREFLLHFGLPSLEDLPPLEEFEETFFGEGDFSGIGGQDEEGPDADREETILREVIAADEEDDEAAEAASEREERSTLFAMESESEDLVAEEDHNDG